MSDEGNEFCIVMTTTDSREEAKKIASGLLDAKLAACVQVMPVESYFRWEGDVQSEAEFLLLIKSRASLFEGIRGKILALHSYDVPEVVSVPIGSGTAGYLEWMKGVTEG